MCVGPWTAYCCPSSQAGYIRFHQACLFKQPWNDLLQYEENPLSRTHRKGSFTVSWFSLFCDIFYCSVWVYFHCFVILLHFLSVFSLFCDIITAVFWVSFHCFVILLLQCLSFSWFSLSVIVMRAVIPGAKLSETEWNRLIKTLLSTYLTLSLYYTRGGI